jgi:hypothetical protein
MIAAGFWLNQHPFSEQTPLASSSRWKEEVLQKISIYGPHKKGMPGVEIIRIQQMG